jgi:hypothetical protein
MIDRYLDDYFPLERAMIYVRQHNRNTGGRIPQINSTPLFDLGALSLKTQIRLRRPADLIRYRSKGKALELRGYY